MAYFFDARVHSKYFIAIMTHTIGQLLNLHGQFLSSHIGLSSYCKINILIIGLDRVLLHHLHGLEVKWQNIETKSDR